MKMRTTQLTKSTFFACALVAICTGLGKPAFAQTEAWVARYDGPGHRDDHARAVAVDTSGNVYVTGESWVPGRTDEYATVKYDSAGNMQWLARYSGPTNGPDHAKALAVDVSGNVYVTGHSVGPGLSWDYATVKYDSTGKELWAARYNGPGDSADYANALAIDTDGNVYVTGGSYAALPFARMGENNHTDYATIKYDSEGNEKWVARYNGPGNRDDNARALAVDSLGNVYVTGDSWHTTNTDYATVKYDSAGIQQWAARYNGFPGNYYDDAHALAVDASGNVYVTGMSRHDYATIKYDSAGSEQWVARYNGPGNGFDQASALAVDASGNVHVTGWSPGVRSIDYATIKYDSAGTERWIARYNAPGNNADFAKALALDISGNVFVTGHSDAYITGTDYATVKYDSAGNEQWVARYNGLGSQYDVATAMALDHQGNVHVTGYSWNGSNVDYATVKYVPGAEVVPASFSMLRGSVISGNLASLRRSDNYRLIMGPAAGFSNAEPPIQVILNAIAPTLPPSGFSFSLESNATIASAEQKIALYNFDNESYEVLDTRLATTSDGLVRVDVAIEPSRFIQVGTLAIRAKVTFRALGARFVYPWEGRIDKVWWTFPG